MRRLMLTIVLVALGASSTWALVIDNKPVRPVTTYSIVARDSATGQFGVAVQSHWFSVGGTVPWVEAGVGAVATQSLTNISFGPLGLDLMRGGNTAEKTLLALLATDENKQWRQVGMIDARGNIAVHTGQKCIREAGHIKGDDFVVMANLMEKNTVWQAMADAYRTTEGDLVERLLSALEAAEGEGGDIRGRQSAAIVIVSGNPTGIPYRDRLVDLRVEDHPTPVQELRRLVSVNRAYKFMNDGDEMLASGDAEGALAAYGRAMELAPDITEIQFWSALTLFTSGQEEEALEFFKAVFEKDENWMEVLRRLPQSDLLQNDAGQVARILSVMSEGQ